MIKNEIRKNLDAILGPRGFARRSSTWTRRTDDFIDIVDLQVSKSADLVTMNAGVMHVGVYRAVWGKEPSSAIDEASATVRVRAGQLLGGEDVWWSQESLPSASEFRLLCEQHLLPFLGGLHSLEALEAHLLGDRVEKQPYPLPKIYLALLRMERGDRDGGCALLSQTKESSVAAWQQRISEIATRMRCQ